MSKEKDLHIRLNEDDHQFLEFLCEKYECSKTELVTELIRCGNYTILNYDMIRDFNRIFGNIGNNINQIARALNIIKRTQIMSEQQYDGILQIYESLSNEYSKHQMESDKMLRKIYRIKLKKEKINYTDIINSGIIKKEKIEDE